MSHPISRRRAAAGLAATAASAGAALAQATDQSLTFLGWSQTEPGSKPTLEAMFDKFRADNPAIRFEVIGVPFGQMQTTLLLRRRSNQRTDVAQIQDRWLTQLVTAGGLSDADAVFGKAFMDGTFIESAMPMATARGRRFAVPWITGSTLLVAHAQLLADAGVTRMPETVDEFIDALRKVKKAKPESSPLGFTTKGAALAALEAEPYLWNFGASYFDEAGKVAVDSDAARRALTMLSSLVKEGLVLPGNDRFDFRRLYARGLVAFYADPPLARAFARAESGQGEAYDRNIVPVNLPVTRSGNPSWSLTWGHTLGLYERGGAAPAPDSPAAKFVRHLLSRDSQLAYFRATGVFPSTREAVAAIADDRYVVRWIELSRHLRNDEFGQFTNNAELIQIAGEEIIASLLGQKTPEAAIATMAQRLTAANPQR